MFGLRLCSVKESKRNHNIELLYVPPAIIPMLPVNIIRRDREWAISAKSLQTVNLNYSMPLIVGFLSKEDPRKSKQMYVTLTYDIDENAWIMAIPNSEYNHVLIIKSQTFNGMYYRLFYDHIYSEFHNHDFFPKIVDEVAATNWMRSVDDNYHSRFFAVVKGSDMEHGVEV